YIGTDQGPPGSVREGHAGLRSDAHPLRPGGAGDRPLDPCRRCRGRPPVQRDAGVRPDGGAALRPGIGGAESGHAQRTHGVRLPRPAGPARQPDPRAAGRRGRHAPAGGDGGSRRRPERGRAGRTTRTLRRRYAERVLRQASDPGEDARDDGDDRRPAQDRREIRAVGGRTVWGEGPSGPSWIAGQHWRPWYTPEEGARVYLAHFGLGEAPFSITPDPRFLYLSE